MAGSLMMMMMRRCFLTLFECTNNETAFGCVCSANDNDDAVDV